MTHAPPRCFYHGTRAALKPGDLIRPGYSSNYTERRSPWVYFSETLNAATWGAELARGDGPGRIYEVEPSGAFMDDPNLTDKKFPGNPTKSYRSREPLRVVRELLEWQGHSSEEIQAMKDGIAGKEPLDDQPHELSPVTRRRLDIQGFERCDDATLAPVAPWLRLAFALCALVAGVGTALGSPGLLLLLAPVAALAAVLPVHPFDLIYNLGIRRLTGTGPLPRRGAPSRFACGLGAVWLLPTAWLFSSGRLTAGYVLGGLLTGVAALVSTTDICVPSLMFRSVFGFPPRRPDRAEE